MTYGSRRLASGAKATAGRSGDCIAWATEGRPEAVRVALRDRWGLEQVRRTLDSAPSFAENVGVAADPLPVRQLGPAAHLAGWDRRGEPFEELGLATVGCARLRSVHGDLSRRWPVVVCRRSPAGVGLLIPRDGIRRLDLASPISILHRRCCPAGSRRPASGLAGVRGRGEGGRAQD